MTSYVLQRTLQMIVVVLGVVTVTFFAVRLVPGDPARLMEPPGTPESVIKLTRERIGTDKPIPEQYVTFLGDFVRGDLGTSFRGGRPVLETVIEAVPNTIALGVVSMAITTVLAFSIGIASALRPNGWFDRTALIFSSIAQATPSFWLGVMLALLFAVELRWLPAIGMEGPKSFILPVTTLVISLIPLQIRAVRQSFIETLGEGSSAPGAPEGCPSPEFWVSTS